MISQSLNTHLCYPIKDKEAAKWPTHPPTSTKIKIPTSTTFSLNHTLPKYIFAILFSNPKILVIYHFLNGICSSSYNSVSHWSCACFYFYFIWFLLMINFQHPTVTEVVGWAGSLKGYCFLNGEPHAPSNYIYCLLTAAPHLIKGISWKNRNI